MLRKILNQWVTKRKGFDYKIDDRTPTSYLINLVISRLFMLMNGFLSGVSNKGSFFLGGNTIIKARSLVRVGNAVTIEQGVFIDAVSTDGICLGNNVSVGRNTRIEATGNLKHLGKGLVVGNNVGLGKGSFYGCSGGIVIQDDTIIGDFVSFHSENHVVDDPGKLIRLQGVTHKGITVGKNCWIGAKSTILDGAIISNGCVIAAGAVVKAGIYPANGIYGGVPARLIRYRTEVPTLSNQLS